MKEKTVSVLLLLSLICLIAFAPIAESGAARGLLLWFNQILPVLFPFTLVVQALLNGNTVSWISRWLAPLVIRIFGLSPACGFCILAGFLSGYPMGAMAAVQAFKESLISREEAQLLAGTCNNAGIMFIGSYILGQQLNISESRFSLMLIFYGSAFFWLFIRSRCLKKNKVLKKTCLGYSMRPNTEITFRQILLNSSELMLKIGVFMMLFAILCEIPGSLPFISTGTAALLSMLLEITNGAAAVAVLNIPYKIKTALIMGSTAFGGLSITCQTWSIIHAQGLSLKKYLFDKAIISLITGALCLLWLAV